MCYIDTDKKRAMNSLDNVLAAFVTQMSSPKSRHFHRNQNYSQAQQRWVMSYSVDSNFPNIIYPLRTLESTSQKNQIKLMIFFPTQSAWKCWQDQSTSASLKKQSFVSPTEICYFHQITIRFTFLVLWGFWNVLFVLDFDTFTSQEFKSAFLSFWAIFFWDSGQWTGSLVPFQAEIFTWSISDTNYWPTDDGFPSNQTSW